MPESKKGTLAQVFSREFCEISKTTFSHRTPLMAASLTHTVTQSNLYNMACIRSSQSHIYYKVGVLKNSTKFTGL